MIKRYEKNPILMPDFYSSWESLAVFNPCPVLFKNKIYLLYRALSLPHYHHLAQTVLSVSDIGISESYDGINFKNRQKFIWPEFEWEKFGCEDPRVVFFEGKYYIFYTALSTYPFSPEGIKIGLAITSDFKKIEKHQVTPFNSKAMTLFPERILNKIVAILTVNTDKPPVEIAIWYGDKIEDLWNHDNWHKWYKLLKKYTLDLKRKNDDYIEVGAPPIKTDEGWLLIYSYIRNYFSPQRTFTVEAVLLDLENPFKIIARTEYPLLFPLQYYEKVGLVPNVVFPSGALVRNNQIYLYYGGADTVCCLAFIDKEKLLTKLLAKKKYYFIRYARNPIIKPSNKKWENKATFNPGAIYLNKKVHLLYRAIGENNTSVLGYATSKDGFHIDFRSPEPIYLPREEFEQKKDPNLPNGCEDPRLTLIAEDKKIYLLYTAYDGINPPKVALSSIDIDDFLNQNWNWAKPKVISYPYLDNKDACLFPEKINGFYWFLHRIGNDIDIAKVNNLDFKNSFLGETRWIYPRNGYWDSEKVGAAAPPIKTKYGWLIFYHGVDENRVYRVGAVLSELKNPLKIIARSYEPLLEPQTNWEKEGLVPNVVFPCGAVLIKDVVFLYYGGADKYCGVATLELKKIIKHLGLK